MKDRGLSIVVMARDFHCMCFTFVKFPFIVDDKLLKHIVCIAIIILHNHYA